MYEMRLLLLMFISVPAFVGALECIQCSKGGNWMSDEEQERYIENCQMGQIEPTTCGNRSHTHCIVSWFRSGGHAERIVTERKCGAIDDVTGCTLYNAKISRKVRHLLNNDKSSANRPRDTAPTFVEVCSESCPFGDCINSSASLGLTLALLISIVTLLR